MTADVNAGTKAALDAGVSDLIVLDTHHGGGNLYPDKLVQDRRITYHLFAWRPWTPQPQRLNGQEYDGSPTTRWKSGRAASRRGEVDQRHRARHGVSIDEQIKGHPRIKRNNACKTAKLVFCEQVENTCMLPRDCPKAN